jgi:hypothetical protein
MIVTLINGNARTTFALWVELVIRLVGLDLTILILYLLVSYIKQDHHNIFFYNMLKLSTIAYKVWELTMMHSLEIPKI